MAPGYLLVNRMGVRLPLDMLEGHRHPLPSFTASPPSPPGLMFAGVGGKENPAVPDLTLLPPLTRRLSCSHSLSPSEYQASVESGEGSRTQITGNSLLCCIHALQLPS